MLAKYLWSSIAYAWSFFAMLSIIQKHIFLNVLKDKDVNYVYITDSFKSVDTNCLIWFIKKDSMFLI